ncbi:MAG: GIY-YIG nuclease family protein [Pseudomonadota bacterium]
MPITIRNFGHYWSRNLVNWGARGRNNNGDLLGYVTKERVPRVTDFRDQIGIYVLFDEHREVVYLGQTGNGNRRLFLRLRDHTRDHLRDRWTNFSWFGFRSVNGDGSFREGQNPDSKIQGKNTDSLDEIEAILLQLFEPRLNKQGPKWRTTDEYLQYVPSEYEESEDRVDLLLQKVEKIESMIGKPE